jgi:hypothetical protein
VRRITILLATVAALLLVPVAAASAAVDTHIITEGSGSGTVVSAEPQLGNPPIKCRWNGKEVVEFESGKASVCDTEATELEEEGFSGINAVAKAAPGSKFVGWKVDSGTVITPIQCKQIPKEPGSNCVVQTFGEEIKIKAVFELSFALTIAKTGEGTITSNPAGIECTGAKTGAECEAEFKPASTVTLTASPATGYAFSSWSGCTEHVGLTCKVTMSKATTVKASFVATPSFTVEKAGSGQGKVSATGISCDESCSKASSAIKAGTSVTVKVASAKGSEPAVFEGGTGSASGCSGATCTFTISENSSVIVKFNAAPTKTLIVKLEGPAKYKGKVTGKGTLKGLYGAAISCGSGCTTQTESFFSTDTITLTATAGTGYTFGGWGPGSGVGTCKGKTTPCTLKVTETTPLFAAFE